MPEFFNRACLHGIGASSVKRMKHCQTQKMDMKMVQIDLILNNGHHFNIIGNIPQTKGGEILFKRNINGIYT